MRFEFLVALFAVALLAGCARSHDYLVHVGKSDPEARSVEAFLNGGQLPPDDDDENECPSRSEIEQCADELGIDAERLIVVGNKSETSVTSSSPIVMRIAGNKSDVHLRVIGEHDPALKGVCIFATGNKAHVEIVVETAVKKLTFIARGNKAYGHLTVAQGGKIESLVASLQGNKAEFVIDGDGEYDCPGVGTCSK